MCEQTCERWTEVETQPDGRQIKPIKYDRDIILRSQEHEEPQSRPSQPRAMAPLIRLINILIVCVLVLTITSRLKDDMLHTCVSGTRACAFVSRTVCMCVWCVCVCVCLAVSLMCVCVYPFVHASTRVCVCVLI